MMNILLVCVILISINNVKCTFDSFKRKPNIILFFCDDLGWNDIGFHLSNHLSTPNIDSLAADGIILNRYYTQPLCTPSRGALMTGKRPIHIGLQNSVINAATPYGLPLEHKILPQYLKKYGYSTHAIGKWHLGFFRKEYTPTYRGFDSHIGFWNGGQDYFNHSFVEGGQIGYDFRNNLDLIPIQSAAGIYATEYLTDKTLNLINNHDVDQPLFLYMAYPNVHAGCPYDPLQAPQRLIDRFSYINDEKRRILAANAYSMDESIGKIVNKLHDKHMMDNSIILFLSDNGGAYSGFHENSGSNYPLRGTKGTLREGGVRVPAFIWSPLLKSRYVSNSLIHVTDILPTLVEAIDKKSVEFKKNKIDGISMWKSLFNIKISEPKEILLNVDPIYKMSAIIVDKWKLIEGTLPSRKSANPEGYSPSYESSISSHQLKTITHKLKTQRFSSPVFKVLTKLKRNPDFNIFNKTLIDCGLSDQKLLKECDINEKKCLYDIKSDPCEYNNLAESYPHIVKWLWIKIVNYNKTSVEPLSTTPIDKNAYPIYHNNTWDIWVQ